MEIVLVHTKKVKLEIVLVCVPPKQQSDPEKHTKILWTLICVGRKLWRLAGQKSQRLTDRKEKNNKSLIFFSSTITSKKKKKKACKIAKKKRQNIKDKKRKKKQKKRTLDMESHEYNPRSPVLSDRDVECDLFYLQKKKNFACQKAPLSEKKKQKF